MAEASPKSVWVEILLRLRDKVFVQLESDRLPWVWLLFGVGLIGFGTSWTSFGAANVVSLGNIPGLFFVALAVPALLKPAQATHEGSLVDGADLTLTEELNDAVRKGVLSEREVSRMRKVRQIHADIQAVQRVIAWSKDPGRSATLSVKCEQAMNQVVAAYERAQ